jgi:hypothetical protein
MGKGNWPYSPQKNCTCMERVGEAARRPADL